MASSSSVGDEINQLAAAGSPVTSCLHLKPDAAGAAAGRRSLDRDVVLQRIRRRKRVNQFQTALQSPLRPDPAAEKDGEPSGWLDDAFTSP